MDSYSLKEKICFVLVFFLQYSNCLSPCKGKKTHISKYAKALDMIQENFFLKMR